MPLLRQRHGSDVPVRDPVGSDAAPRPVVLATLSVRVHPEAERMAIDSALDAGGRLIIANMLWLPPHPTTLTLAREVAVLPHEEDLGGAGRAGGAAAHLVAKAAGGVAGADRGARRRLGGAGARSGAHAPVVAGRGRAADPQAGGVSGLDRPGLAPGLG
jgi:hypothetical protein